MSPNQTNTIQQKTGHIISASGVKPTTIAVAATAANRATTIVTAAPRKREHGKQQKQTRTFELKLRLFRT